MESFTLYYNEAEERDRKQRRRTKIAGAIAIIATLMAMRRRPEPPPAPKPTQTLIVRTETVAVPVVVTRTRTVTENVTVRAPRYYKPLPLQWSMSRDGLPPSGLPARHLCVTPKRLTVATSDHLIVSNVGDTPIRISAIASPEGTGFVVDTADCANKELKAGERCAIEITVREAPKQPIHLLIDDDRGDYDIAEITASPASRGPAS